MCAEAELQHAAALRGLLGWGTHDLDHTKLIEIVTTHPVTHFCYKSCPD